MYVQREFSILNITSEEPGSVNFAQSTKCFLYQGGVRPENSVTNKKSEKL